MEAPDEAGHAGDLEEKIRAIERVDNRILGKLLDELPDFGDYSIAILPDHPTPLSLKTHTSDPVPYSMYSTTNSSDDVMVYDEFSVRKGIMGVQEGYKFIQNFIHHSILG